MALSGTTTFNPATDFLTAQDGSQFKLSPPKSNDLPESGFLQGRPAFGFPIQSEPDESVSISIDSSSDRLQLLDSFSKWDHKEFTDLRVLVKVAGKCTTDHISAAGPWLKVHSWNHNVNICLVQRALGKYQQKHIDWGR